MVGAREVAHEPYRRDPDERIEELQDLVGRAVKMLPPLVTRTPSGRLQLLAGGRRFHAQVAAGKEKVRVYVAHDMAALAAWLELDDRERYPGSMTISELATFSIGAIQQLHLNVRSVSTLDQELAKRFGVALDDLRNTRQLVNRLNAEAPGYLHDQIAADIQLVDSGLIRPSSAISRDTLRRKEVERAANAPSAEEQAKMLARVIPGLRSTVEALRDMGPVSPDIPDEELKQAERAFREVYRTLARIVRQIGAIRESE